MFEKSIEEMIEYLDLEEGRCESTIDGFIIEFEEADDMIYYLVEDAAGGIEPIWLPIKKNKAIDSGNPVIFLIKNKNVTRNGNANTANKHAANVKIYCNSFKGLKGYSEENGFQIPITDITSQDYKDTLAMIPSNTRQLVKKFIDNDEARAKMNEFYQSEQDDTVKRINLAKQLRDIAVDLGIKPIRYEKKEEKYKND